MNNQDNKSLKTPRDYGEIAHRVVDARQKYQAVKAIIVACLFVPAAIVMAINYFSKGAAEIGRFLLLFASGWTLITVYIVRIGFKKRTRQTTAETPFQGMETLETKTTQMFDRTAWAPDEKLSAFLGPIERSNLNAQSIVILGKEHIKAAENTLLLTNKQIIGIAAVQQDFEGMSVDTANSGFRGGLAQVASVADTARDQKLYVEMLQRKNWPTLIAKWQQHMPEVLEEHYQFGISLSELKSVEAKDRFVNPGIHIELTNGQVLKYASLQKEQVVPFAEALQAAIGNK